MSWFLVALGGAVGTAGRYGIALLGQRWAGEAWFPWGTFSANVLGSFLLGLVFVTAEGRTFASVDARLVLGTGVMGGFTTYSAFNLEALKLFSDTSAAKGAAYITATVLLCLAAGAAGLALGRFVHD